MKKAKILKAKKEEIKEEIETYSLKKLVIIIIVVALVFGIFYFITTLFVHPINNNSNDDQKYIMDDETISLNHLLDRSEKEYYVIAFKKSDSKNFLSQVNYSEIYEKYISNYSLKEENVKFYKVNLNEAINKNYLDNQANITNSLEELKLSDDTLFKVYNGKIVEHYIGYNEIIKKLSSM